MTGHSRKFDSITDALTKCFEGPSVTRKIFHSHSVIFLLSDSSKFFAGTYPALVEDGERLGNVVMTHLAVFQQPGK